VKLANEDFQTELAKPCKEEGISTLKNWMAISKPHKAYNLWKKDVA
jgi:hypothetical protein